MAHSNIRELFSAWSVTEHVRDGPDAPWSSSGAIKMVSPGSKRRGAEPRETTIPAPRSRGGPVQRMGVPRRPGVRLKRHAMHAEAPTGVAQQPVRQARRRQ